MSAMTRNEFIKRLNAAKPGERIIYHTGLLMADRKWHIDAPPAEADKLRTINDTANEAYHAATLNQCHLFQERVQVGICHYVAVKR